MAPRPQTRARTAGRPDQTDGVQSQLDAAHRAILDDLRASLPAMLGSAIKTAVDTALTPLLSRLQRVEQRASDLEAQQEQLENMVFDLQRQVEMVQGEGYRQDLVVSGLPQPAGGTTEAAFSRACREVGISEPTFQEVRQLGRQTEASRPPKVLVRLASVSAKHQLFKAKRALAQIGVYLDDRLTPAQQAARQQQLAALMHLKRLGLRPHWRQARLHYVEAGRVKLHQLGDPLPSQAAAAATAPATATAATAAAAAAAAAAEAGPSRLPGPPPRAPRSRSRTRSPPSSRAPASASRADA